MATNSKVLVAPVVLALYLKWISEAEMLVTPSSNSPSKSESTKSWSFGSKRVTFLLLGPIFKIKNSPSEIVWSIALFCVNLKFTFCVKFNSYCNLESTAGFTVEVKFPVLVPIKELLASDSVYTLDIIVEFVELSWKIICGLSISAILIVAFPRDSSQFKIPSLSISTSKLSMIKSPSKSSGHILTGISADSKVVLVHSILPIKRYFPGSDSIGLYVSSVLLCSQIEEVSLKYSHLILSNKSVLAACRVIFGIQFPKELTVVSKLISGAVGKPE